MATTDWNECAYIRNGVTLDECWPIKNRGDVLKALRNLDTIPEERLRSYIKVRLRMICKRKGIEMPKELVDALDVMRKRLDK